MKAPLQLRWFYILCALFIALNTALIYHDLYWLYLTPIIVAIIAIAFLSIDILFLLCVIATPLSVDLKETDIGASLSLPAEPLMIALMIMFIFKVFAEKNMDTRILKHPVSIAIYFYLGWILITSITSEIPLVSFKFFASKLWFIIPFYFLGTQVFRKFVNVKWFVWCYVIAMGVVIVYTIQRHAIWNFEQQPANWVMTPFYYDHTQYGAALAMFFPFLTGINFTNRSGLFIKIVISLITVLYTAAIILSYTRAAWVSIAGALGLFIVFAFRIKWQVIALGLTTLLFLFFGFQNEIIMQLEENKQDSSGELSEHVQSISNISTDASNVERLLRWKCAIRMFNERPITGWGPGTYTFVYAPFQRSYEMTIISTNFGDVGNAHSEYLGPLSEQGILGPLTLLAIIITTFITGIKIWNSNADNHIRYTGMMLLLGLCTYWAHGFLNNFLDTDKLSVPFWGFIAVIVAIDVYYIQPSNESASK